MTPVMQMEKLDPEKEALQAEAASLGLIKVVDPATYAAAGERWKALVQMEKKVHEHFDPTCEAAHKTWKAAVALREKFLEPLDTKKKEQTRLMKSWEREQEEIRREAERKAQEEARKKAEDDALAQAEAAEKEGTPQGKAAAEEILSAPVQVPQVVAPTVVPKGFGAATRRTWKAQVTDTRAFVEAVASGVIPIAAIIPNESFLNNQARQLKTELAYPGVRVWEE